MMIIDSHCHAWTYWPYTPAVPDPESRGRIEQLLHEMDTHGVQKAVIICAQIDHNPDNNAYIAEQVKKYPDRLIQFADVDSEWSESYHQQGAAKRLAEIRDQYHLKGFTHYLKSDEDGSWLLSDEGMKFFEVVAEKKLVASISCRPHHHHVLHQLAERFPSVPILIHHMGLATHSPDHGNIQDILESAKYPNFYIKISGFAHNSTVRKWDFPYKNVQWLVRVIYEYFGADRMCWGSDYPVVRFAMTYQQSLEMIRSHCDFISDDDRAKILGLTTDKLLANAG